MRILFRTEGAPTVAAFVFLPTKDGLQQKGEGYDGRLVQASLSDASRLERFSIQDVRLALGPLCHPKPGMGPLFWGPFFSVGMGPFGRSWGSKFRCGTKMKK